MTQIMTAPKMITDGQIENVVNKLRDAMRKHRSEISAERAQIALGFDNLGMRMFQPFREITEAVSRKFIRKVSVDHSYHLRGVLFSLVGFNIYEESQEIDGVSLVEKGEIDLHFFSLTTPRRDGHISIEDLVKEYEQEGLKPAHPSHLALVIQQDRKLVDNLPNSTIWKNGKGHWCHLVAHRFGDGYQVRVAPTIVSLPSNWQFAGVRK